MDIFSIIDHSNAIYSIIMLVFGTGANLLSCIVCLQADLRKIPTYVFYAFLTLTSALSLYWWNIDTVTSFFLKTSIYAFTPTNFICHFITIGQCFTYQWSSWLLVLLSIERLLTLSITKWRTKYFNSKKAIISSILMGLIILIVNVGLASYLAINQTGEFAIDCTVVILVNISANVFLQSIIPIVLIFVFNSLLLIKIISTKNRVSDIRIREVVKERTFISVSILILTTIFILFTLPSTLTNYYIYNLSVLKNGTTYIRLANSLQYTFNSFNFIIFLMNKSFRLAVVKLFENLKRPKSNVVLPFNQTRSTNY